VRRREHPESGEITRAAVHQEVFESDGTLKLVCKETQGYRGTTISGTPGRMKFYFDEQLVAERGRSMDPS
jgi:hypothetical protein